MKKQLAIILGMSLAAGTAVAGDKGEKQETAADRDITYQTAEDKGTTMAKNFEDLDVNQDSLISEQEATDAEALDSEAFASADTDQDGYLSSTEFDASVDAGSNLQVPETEHQEKVLEDDPS